MQIVHGQVHFVLWAKLIANSKTSYEYGVYSTTVQGNAYITLNYTSYKMGVGDVFPLTATLTNSDGESSVFESNINWSSSNEDVATVTSDGTVTAKKEGTATIYAKWKSDETVQATCKVTVEKDNSNPDSGSGTGGIVIPDDNSQDIDNPTSSTQNKVENTNKPTSVSGNLDDTKAEGNIPQTGVNYTALFIITGFVIVGYIGYRKYQKYDI